MYIEHPYILKLMKYPLHEKGILNPNPNLNSSYKYHNILGHGGLYRWRENSLPFFLYQKLKEILTKYSRTILTSSKNWLISKI